MSPSTYAESARLSLASSPGKLRKARYVPTGGALGPVPASASAWQKASAAAWLPPNVPPWTVVAVTKATLPGTGKSGSGSTHTTTRAQFETSASSVAVSVRSHSPGEAGATAGAVNWASSVCGGQKPAP